MGVLAGLGQKPWSPPQREQVYVFFPSDLDQPDLDQRLQKARDVAAGDVDRLHVLEHQKSHIDVIKRTNKHYGSFTDSDDLIKQCLTLDLPTIPRTKPNNLPYGSLGSLFKGRDETLEKLHSHLTPSARILRLSADLVS